jgi:cytochrome oxidase Cu insertion factor (SCO1/SenC/PrrC family)
MAEVATDGAAVPGTGGVPDEPDAPDAHGETDPAPVANASPPSTDLAPGISGPPRIPRRTVQLLIAAALGLLLLTVVINRIASSASTPSATTQTTQVQQVVGGSAPPLNSAQLHAPLRNLLDLTRLRGRQPKPFSLTDAATGRVVTLSALAGHVVVLTFADANCKDICPVLAAELHQAAADLAKTRVPVSFVTVNSDPLETAPTHAAILRQPLFASLPGWMFLTGSVHRLNRVWVDYGISITADPATGVASHNDLMYFISRKGTLEWSALLFADESPDGTFSLPQPVIARFAEGIARYAAKLAR